MSDKVSKNTDDKMVHVIMYEYDIFMLFVTDYIKSHIIILNKL